MKVQEILTENPAALAVLFANLLSKSMHYARNVVGAGRPAAQTLQQVRNGLPGKNGALNPSQEQLRALAQQGQKIENSTNYLRSRSARGPAQGTQGPKAANQAIKDATKEIRNILKTVPSK